ncbi:hypothetical protein TA3x_000439 [Tundrisphaera sp. TA3]
MNCNCLRCRIFDFLDTPAELLAMVAGLWTCAMAWICGVEIYMDEDGGD